jgi:hypothetical protein
VRRFSSHPDTIAATPAPTIGAATKAGADVGAMPAKMLLRDFAIVTVGLANEVEA